MGGIGHTLFFCFKFSLVTQSVLEYGDISLTSRSSRQDDICLRDGSSPYYLQAYVHTYRER